MNTPNAKEELRRRLRLQRKGISEADFIQWSRQIIESLKEQEEYRRAQTIHSYVSMNKRREVNTHPLIQEMIGAGKTVVVPQTQFEDSSLHHFKLASFDDLIENKWGVLEPLEGGRVSAEELDLVIVPMVGGDRRKHRIGYGGGFYDRFLSRVRCPKIGLCFEQNVVEELPTESFDVALDKIISEEQIVV